MSIKNHRPVLGRGGKFNLKFITHNPYAGNSVSVHRSKSAHRDGVPVLAWSKGPLWELVVISFVLVEVLSVNRNVILKEAECYIGKII